MIAQQGFNEHQLRGSVFSPASVSPQNSESLSHTSTILSSRCKPLYATHLHGVLSKVLILASKPRGARLLHPPGLILPTRLLALGVSALPVCAPLLPDAAPWVGAFTAPHPLPSPGALLLSFHFAESAPPASRAPWAVILEHCLSPTVHHNSQRIFCLVGDPAHTAFCCLSSTFCIIWYILGRIPVSSTNGRIDV